MAATALPKDVSKLGQDVKLFGKWDTQECVMITIHIRVSSIHGC